MFSLLLKDLISDFYSVKPSLLFSNFGCSVSKGSISDYVVKVFGRYDTLKPCVSVPMQVVFHPRVECISLVKAMDLGRGDTSLWCRVFLLMQEMNLGDVTPHHSVVSMPIMQTKKIGRYVPLIQVMI